MPFFMKVALLRRNREFRLLYFAYAVSFIGTMVTTVALPYQIYQQTHSVLLVGLLSLAQLVPLLFTALIGGAFSDRYHRHALLLISQILLSVGSLLLFVNAYLHTIHVWPLFLIAPFMSGLTGILRPALDGVKQQILEKKDLPEAAALSSLLMSSGMIVGPSCAGLIIAYAGVTFAYLVDFFSFVISIALLFLMRPVPKPTRAVDQSTLQALNAGVRYAISRKDLLGTYLVDFVAMVFGMPIALFPALVVNYGGAQVLGLFYAAPAVGALVATLFSGWVAKVPRRGVAIIIAALLWGVSIILFGLSTHLWWALFFLALAGGFDAYSVIFRSVVWNESIPSEFRGRLSGIEMISFISGPKLGDTEAGLMAALGGISFSIISGGVLCIIGVAVCCLYIPELWRYQTVMEHE